MARIYIRYAAAKDVERLVRDGVIKAPAPGGEPWETRIRLWLAEQSAGRRVILVAEDGSGLLGMIQLVFRFPPGVEDPEAANGFDVAMLESLHLRAGAPPQLAQQLIADVQALARKKNVKTLTFCIPMHQPKALAQVKAWGFEEFRIMPENSKMLAFFRKSTD